MATGTSTSFEALVREHASLVARIASTYERRPALIDELVQDVFFAVYQSISTFRAQSSVRTFVARIAHNVCVDHVRKATRRPTEVAVELGLTVADPDRDQELETDEALRRRQLVRAVRELDLPLKQVIGLHLEGFTNVEIADALSLSASNVGVRLHRAKQQLHATMRAQPEREVR